jgi:hypothetical protein
MKSFLSLVALAITCAELAYWLGGRLRLTLDARNDQLARWWVSVLGVGPVVPPEAPAVAPVAARTPRARKAAAAPAVAPAAPAGAPRPARRARKSRAVEVVAA